jgi:uncharacterized protein YjaG (DUF416 family)
MIPFSKDALARQLSAMSPAGATRFGVLCLGRMLPAYRRFAQDVGWGDPDLLQSVVSGVATDEIGPGLPALTQLRERVRQVIPDSDAFNSEYTGAAQEAALGVECLLDYLLEGNPADVAQIAAFAIDSLDRAIQEADRLDPNDPGLEAKIQSHPLMQRELAMQAEDLRNAQRS